MQEFSRKFGELNILPYLCGTIRVLSSVGLERLLDRQEVSSSNLLDPTEIEDGQLVILFFVCILTAICCCVRVCLHGVFVCGHVFM